MGVWLPVQAHHLVDQPAEVDHRHARDHILAHDDARHKALHRAAQVGAHKPSRRAEGPAVQICTHLQGLKKIFSEAHPFQSLT